jgi:molybdopterin synthase catalytic subunit
MLAVQPPVEGLEWLALVDGQLPVGVAHDWAVLPSCGAVVVFSGTTRDHSVDEEGRRRLGVTELAYEAYEEQVVPRFAAIAAELRTRWPATGRVVVLHRAGRVALGEISVLVVVSAPHRGDAFAAARFAIDAVKASAPIWKHERWADGDDWGTGAHGVVEPSALSRASDASAR